MKETSKEKEELGSESLQQRRWYWKLCYFYKLLKEQSPNYLFRLIPKENTRYAIGTQKPVLSVELIMNVSRTLSFLGP